ncbi:hypothetical protein M0R88_06415 [Halorussus gelatinilyticus]|uniref:DUF8052 domain-containing protein n=1 Tax=Halorussus gelatinilyticus TaxID=2937524 RepID=A0A8U0IM87_9EURY|nr:hypothetical protein [Halorussus gelatinilyticus]UPW01731.1 hypothetical protein M0R88_06415 [Halorussus gelatinilyticus]
MSDGASDPTDSENGAEVTVGGETVPEAAVPDDVPEWDDEYLDRVSDRLMFSFDLERKFDVRGRTFEMYGEMRIESQKQLFHAALNYGNHEKREHLFVRRADDVSRADLESLVGLGHDLADEWIDADERHFGTDFTFVVVAPELPDDVRSFVSGFRDRTLLKFGYYGDYEVNLVVVAPDEEEAVESEEAEVAAAFRLWESLDEVDESKGLLDRLFG